MQELPSDRHDFAADMSNGKLIREDKFIARLRKRKFVALETALIRADMQIQAATEVGNKDPRKVPALVRILRQRELVVAEMKRRVQGGFQPPAAIVKARPAVVGAETTLMGGQGVAEMPPQQIVRIKPATFASRAPERV